MRGFLLAMLVLAAALTPLPAQAVRPDERLPDPVLEARARAVSKELRCLVCRNQSVDDSDADLAHDLRVLVRERLVAGDSNEQVIAYIRARYGDYVLLRPPFDVDTWLLWGAPLLMVLLGAIWLRRYLRRQTVVAATPPLSADEERRLARILENGAER